MRGLMRKDWEILTLNKKFLAIVVAVSIFMTYSADSGLGFLQMYVPMMAVFLLMSTFSYDDNDNGMAFLMTLPGNRGSYVKEKYLFGFLLSGLCCVLTSAVAAGLAFTGTISGSDLEEIGINFLTSVLFSGIMMAIVFPLMLKYGSEKGRMAMAVVFVAAFGVILLLGRVKDRLPFTFNQNAVDSFMESLGPAMVAVGFLAVTAASLLVSCLISIRIMAKKEF